MPRFAEFDAFLLDTRTRELRRTLPVRMEPAALKLLEILARNAGLAVSRETLLKELCGTDEVEDANVRIAVQKLRFALGDSDAKKDFRLVVTTDGGYKLAPQVRWYDEPPARRKRRRLLAVASAASLLAAGYAAWVQGLAPVVTVHAPTEIEAHEAEVFGEYRAREDVEVVVYVHPDDRGSLYWPQPRPRRKVQPAAWQVKARFGNEFGVDMKQPPPLGFDVVAALVPARARSRFPIEGEGEPIAASDVQEFREELFRRGARAVSHPRRLQRNPEPACLRQMARLLSPAGTTDGSAGQVLLPPIRLAWEPGVPMYAALWRNGVAVPALPAAERIPSGTLLEGLTPGTYQIKVAPMVADTALWCATSAWFVVPEPPR